MANAQSDSSRPSSELLNKEDSAWTLVQDWLKEASNKVEVLPKQQQKAESALLLLQVTTRLPMGAIVYESGGILVDDGWIRIYFKLLSRENFDGALADYSVQVNVVSPKKIRLDLYMEEKIVATKTVKGKIKGDYFYCNYQLFVTPLVPVLYGYRAQRQRIGITGDTLIVDFREDYLMAFIIAAQFDNRQTRYYHKAVK